MEVNCWKDGVLPSLSTRVIVDDENSLKTQALLHDISDRQVSSVCQNIQIRFNQHKIFSTIRSFRAWTNLLRTSTKDNKQTLQYCLAWCMTRYPTLDYCRNSRRTESEDHCCWRYLESFFRYRHMCVIVDGETSSETVVELEVPQDLS